MMILLRQEEENALEDAGDTFENAAGVTDFAWKVT